MDVRTISQNEKNTHETHVIPVKINLEKILNLASVIKILFQLDEKCGGNNLDVETITLVSLYKTLEGSFEGSSYKDEDKRFLMLE